MRDKQAHMHVSDEECGRLPLLRRLQPRPRMCALQGWKDTQRLPFFSPLPPSSCLFAAPANSEGRLNDSCSTFGRCWEYVGLCSLSEPLDSCREIPAAPGPPEDTRPFQTEEGAHSHAPLVLSKSPRNIHHIFWGRKKYVYLYKYL